MSAHQPNTEPSAGADADGDHGKAPLRDQLRTVKIALDLVWGAGRRYVITIVAAMIAVAVVLSLQLLVGRDILETLADSDNAEASELTSSIVLLGILMLIAAIVDAVVRELRNPLIELVERDAINQVLDIATEVEYEAFESPTFYDRVTRALEGASEESAAVVFGIVAMASALMVTIGVTAVLITVVPLLVPIAIVGYVPIAVANLINNRATYALDYELTENERERSYLEDVLTFRDDAKEVRAYGLDHTLRPWHRRLFHTRLELVRALSMQRLRRTVISSTISTVALAGTLAFTLILAQRGTISLGDAAVAIVGLQQLAGRLLSTGDALSKVHEAVTFLRDFETFRADSPIERTGNGTPPPSPPTTLTVEGLGYRYPGAPRDALRTVDLSLERGQIMAIVGANGSGKSTLAKVLCGLLHPQRGCVRWDGVDLADADPRLVRREIAPVFQDYSRLEVELGTAIALSDPDRLDDEDAIEATARRSGLGELVDQHDQGLRSRLGKEFTDGIDVSLGQWQKIAIARALFRDAPFLVFDEPSASLDPHAEAELFELLHDACAEKMVIFVSHRFATVRQADIVVVLDGGEVVESGSHDELMARGGLYAGMFEIQASRFGA